MLHCSRKEHELYTLRTYTKYMFFDRFYFVSHHTPRDSLMCDLWPTLHMNGALTATVIALISSLNVSCIRDGLSIHQKHRRDVIVCRVIKNIDEMYLANSIGGNNSG